MSLTASEVWKRLLDRARIDIPEQTFRTWLEPTEALSLDGDVISVGVPDQFAADWNESKHAELFSTYGPIALGYPIRVIFKVNEERKKRSQMDFFVAPPVFSFATGRGHLSANQAPLSSRYTFDHFVIGKSNELAAAAAHAVSQAPGKVYNPLFIYGDTGIGKTHLMQAIAHDIISRNPQMRISFVGTEQFTNELIGSIQNHTTSSFRRQYRETDLLLIDDVHFLRGKEATQQEFFHTFNALYEAGRQIVLTSDRPPSDIPGLEARLISRFQWGMVADIQLPDFEHRIAILRQKAQLDHLEHTIPEDVIRFIAENVKSSVRELEGSIIKLLAFASLKHKEISIDLAHEALRDKLRPINGQPSHPASSTLTINTIQQIVAQEWGVTAEGLRSKTRTKALTIPRHIAMFLTRDLLGTQLVEIGNAFGGRDHSTVIHSIEKTAEILDTNPSYRSRIHKIRLQLEALRS
ncbi:MAG TPA: chromosomal replication initiator protein DnaA [Gemmatimonadaceae bacterium]|nr:chromosomal replication initiator protein DnaA [Gemmatimonadaceae bacterium]